MKEVPPQSLADEELAGRQRREEEHAADEQKDSHSEQGVQDDLNGHGHNAESSQLRERHETSRHGPLGVVLCVKPLVLELVDDPELEKEEEDGHQTDDSLRAENRGPAGEPARAQVGAQEKERGSERVRRERKPLTRVRVEPAREPRRV
jgi:hypothetical protein